MDTFEAGGEWFYNIRTGNVEHGRQSSWEDLMGPYDSAAEASQAISIAAKRNAQWEDDDASWNGDDA
jgi:hypothetical protein